jgi:molecular chaperone DnaJ
VLSDPEMRREYDQVRAMGSGAGSRRGGLGAGRASRTSSAACSATAADARPTAPAGFEDLLGGMFGGGGFGSSTGGFRGDGGPIKGADITAKTTLDFLTAIRGDTVTLTMQSGRETKVKIPEGVADGQKIRLKGKGQPSPDGGPPGTWCSRSRCASIRSSSARASTCVWRCPVTFVEASLGATIEVPTLDGGPVKLRVAAGTPSGRVLPGQGPGRDDEQGHGRPARDRDVAVPAHLPDKAKSALEDFAAAMPAENPRPSARRAGGTT